MKLITTANKDINKEMMLVPPSFDPCLSKKIEFPISTSNKNIKKNKSGFSKDVKHIHKYLQRKNLLFKSISKVEVLYYSCIK